MPDDLAEVRRRIEQWRTRRSKLGAMPESLWAEAIAMAARHGFWLVACVLRLNCTRLRARLAESVRLMAWCFTNSPTSRVCHRVL